METNTIEMVTTTTTDTTPLLEVDNPKFSSFLDGCEGIYNDYMDAHFPNQKEKMVSHFGSRYVKVYFVNHLNQATRPFAFVDRRNGDVLKPATWNSPAKHARGNIYDDKNGLGMITPYGPQYLRG